MNEEVKINCDNDVMKYSPDQIYDKFDDLQTREQKLQNNWNELKKWLEECLNEIKQNDVYDRTSYEQGQIIALESSIAKVQELEQGKDENN